MHKGAYNKVSAGQQNSAGHVPDCQAALQRLNRQDRGYGVRAEQRNRLYCLDTTQINCAASRKDILRTLPYRQAAKDVSAAMA